MSGEALRRSRQHIDVIDEPDFKRSGPSAQCRGATPPHGPQALRLEAALSYAARGWPVFPLHTATKGRCSCGREACSSPGKHPRTEHGLLDATKDEGIIRRWWRQWPDANIGIVTGEPSGIIVLDVDTRNGGDESLQQLETEHGCLPRTQEARTGGGRHLYFQAPQMPLRSRPSFRAGIDIKAEGGYVVVPPSAHALGTRYRWITDSSAQQAEPPAWLLAALAQPIAGDVQEANGEREAFEEGERNDRLTSLAGFLRSNGFGPSAVKEELQQFNLRRCNPPLDPKEVQAVVQSVCRYPLGPRCNIHAATSEVARSAEKNLRFRTAREIAAETPENPDWVAGPWVAAGSITEVVGKAKAAGKTTFLAHLVRSVLNGEPFLGKPTVKTQVVYLTEEKDGTLREALGRVELSQRDDLHFLPWHMTREVPWPRVVEIAVQKCHDVGAKLLVVDTLPQFAGFKGDQENNTGNALEALEPLQRAAAEGIAVVMVRHERKSGGDVGVSGRGSSAFAGAVDIVLSISRPKEGGETNARVIAALSRFDETPSQVTVELTPDGYRVVSWGGQSASERAESDVLRAIQGLEDVEQGSTIQELIEATHVPRATLQTALDTLVKAGSVQKTGKGVKGDPHRFGIPGNSAETAIPMKAETNERDDQSQPVLAQQREGGP